MAQGQMARLIKEKLKRPSWRSKSCFDLAEHGGTVHHQPSRRMSLVPDSLKKMA